MFGYVRVKHTELKVKEYEFYRGTYCGLCRSMGKCTGQCSRFALSYDFAFLALLRIAFNRTPVEFEQKRCIAHPLKKRNMMKPNDSLAYCAGAAALLNYHKVMDDLADEKGLKKLRALLVRPMMAHARKKALRAGLSELDTRIAELLTELSTVEQSNEKSVDAPAEVFGKLLSLIISHGLDGIDARIASSLGHAIGKWIYIADALDDWQEDAKKGRYNPFLKLYDGKLPTQEDYESIGLALKNELYEAEAAADLLTFDNEAIEEIVSNILYLGLPDRIRQIYTEDNIKKKSKQSKERTENKQ
ncbi:MAG: hypothetical protein J6Q82_00190 [Clostridia bacterium]|nr:hypothetical protein [Clostridia bacterium]